MPHTDPVARYEYQKAYRQRNAEKRAADRPDQDRARNANRRARLYGVVGRLRLADIRAVLHADARCVYCATTERLTIDHITPMSAGGVNMPENLQPCCLSCNISKYRSDRPGRWALEHEVCVECQTTERPHLANGMCNKCHRRDRARRERAAAA